MSKRYPIKLPPWHEKRIIWWAFCKATSKTQLTQNIVQARVEANEAQIESILADRAAEQGKTVEQLKQELLDAAGYVTGTDEVIPDD